jgi:GAF domain-containing protein
MSNHDPLKTHIVDSHFLGQLITTSQLIEQHTNLEEALTELARLTANLINTDRCSIMLLSASEEQKSDQKEEARLRVYAHFGALPEAALRATVRINKGIAGHVLTTRQPLLIENIMASPFAEQANFQEAGNPSLISVPIEVAGNPIGVINVRGPSTGTPLTRSDLELVTIFALFIGKSIQTFQLQRLAESRILQLAILREQQETQAAKPIAPDPSRVVSLVAKNLYRELTAAGFGPNDVVRVTSEVLSLLHHTMQKEQTPPSSSS